MDALYFRVSSEKQTTQNQFDDLIEAAERDDSGRDWKTIRQKLAQAIVEDQRPSTHPGDQASVGPLPGTGGILGVVLCRQCSSWRIGWLRLKRSYHFSSADFLKNSAATSATERWRASTWKFNCCISVLVNLPDSSASAARNPGVSSIASCRATMQTS